jgi:hypothetical protein
MLFLLTPMVGKRRLLAPTLFPAACFDFCWIVLAFFAAAATAVIASVHFYLVLEGFHVWKLTASFGFGFSAGKRDVVVPRDVHL